MTVPSENFMPAIERGKTLADQAYDRLRIALAGGMFKPGEALSIRQLARLLNVSATPARDAISRALWDGSLESGANRTVAVPKLTVEKVQELYAIRLNLEGLATELAATNFGKEAVAELETVYRAYCDAVETGNYDQALKANESFHFSIYNRCGNALLVEFIRTLWLKMGPSLNLLYPAYSDRRGMEHHSRILEALRDRHPAEAKAALQADLLDGRAEVKRAVGALSDGAPAEDQMLANSLS